MLLLTKFRKTHHR